MEGGSGSRAAQWWLGVQVCASFVLVLIGVTIVAAGGLVSGVLLAAAALWWLVRAFRHL